MKKYISLFMVSLMLLTSLFALVVHGAKGNVGNMKKQVIFPSDKQNNYRIPSVITTNSGSVFAFCEDRLNTLDDYAQYKKITVSVARDGENFAKESFLIEKEGWAYSIGSAIYDKEQDLIMLVYYSRIESTEAKAEYSKTPESERDPLGPCIAQSADDGKTWTFRKLNFPSVNVLGKNYTPLVHGSSSGIQISRGEHKGRLVFAAKIGRYDSPDISLMSSGNVSLLVYSDDGGMTWKSSELMPLGTDESTVCELSDGSVMINCRTCYDDNSRYVGISRDGGQTFSKLYKDRILLQTAGFGVRGGLASFENPKNPSKNITLYTCTYSYTYRKNLCMWISFDDGKTWSDIITVNTGRSAYSDLKYNEKNKTVTLLFESGIENANSTGITAMTFDIDWLYANKKELNDKYREIGNLENINPEVINDGLSFHLTPETLINENGEVTGWKDEISGNVLKKQGNGETVFNENGKNGHSSVSFDKSSKAYFEGKLPSSVKESGFTYFIVYRSNGKNADNSDRILARFKNSGLRTIVQSSTNRYNTTLNNGTAVKIVSDTLADSSWHVLAVKWDNVSKCPMLCQYLDGSAEENVSYRSGDAVKNRGDGISVNNIELGENFYGRMSEVCVYDRVLSEREIASVGASLAQKYELEWKGITVSESVKAEESSTAQTTLTEETNEKKGCSSSVMSLAIPASATVSAVVLKNKKKKHRK